MGFWSVAGPSTRTPVMCAAIGASFGPLGKRPLKLRPLAAARFAGGDIRLIRGTSAGGVTVATRLARAEPAETGSANSGRTNATTRTAAIEALNGTKNFKEGNSLFKLR